MGREQFAGILRQWRHPACRPQLGWSWSDLPSGKKQQKSQSCISLFFFVMELQNSAEHKQANQASGFHWLSFAYQGLTEIPYDTILTQTDALEVLDLSYNILDENPALLGQLEKLSTLILDSNNYTSHVKFPYMPSITTVCINKNKINNLPVFVDEIRRKFPNIKILSMMNNEAAPSYFNGGSLSQYIDYRLYVISQIPGLEILDDTEVLEKERVQARKTYRLQQNSLSSRKKKAESPRKHTHMQKKADTIIRQ
ncbi:leucine-rich melanocyte differentiation-associated protein [Anableps anableps]